MESSSGNFHSFIFCRRGNVLITAFHFDLGDLGHAGRQAHQTLVDILEGRPLVPGAGVDADEVPDVMTADIIGVRQAMDIMGSLPRDQQMHYVWDADRACETGGSAMREAYLMILEALDEEDGDVHDVASPVPEPLTPARSSAALTGRVGQSSAAGIRSDGEECGSSDSDNGDTAGSVDIYGSRMSCDSAHTSSGQRSLTCGISSGKNRLANIEQTAKVWCDVAEKNATNNLEMIRVRKRKASDEFKKTTESNKKRRTVLRPATVAKWMRL